MYCGSKQSDKAHMNEEKLLEFLYVAPVALIEFDSEGKVRLANPRVAQLFNRYAPGGYFANLFSFLDDVLPELKSLIVSYPHESGQIMENQRFCISAPTANDFEKLWLDVTIMKQGVDQFIASLNNVTNQVRIETEKYTTEQKMTKVLESVVNHVVFTLSPEGVIDSWNTTGETYLCDKKMAIGKVLSQVIKISLEENAQLLNAAKQHGKDTRHVELKDRAGMLREAEFCISAIVDQHEQLRGFSVVLSLNS